MYRKEVTADTDSWKLLCQSTAMWSQREGQEGTRFPSRGRRGERKVWAWGEWPEGRGQTKETAQSSVSHEDPLCVDSAVGEQGVQAQKQV